MDEMLGEELRNEGVELHSLPPYDTFKLVKEHSTAIAVSTALVSVIVATILWRFVRYSEQQQLKHLAESPSSIRRGKFNSYVVGNLRRTARPSKNTDARSQCTDRTQLTNDAGERSDSGGESTDDGVDSVAPESIKREGDSLEEIRAMGNRDIKLKRSNQTDSDDELNDRIEEEDEEDHEDGHGSRGSSSRKPSSPDNGDKVDLVGTLGKLHGKLATAELRAKTNRLQKEMTEEQKNEEQEIRAKQLEAIYTMMMTDCDKFGLHDKAEMMEQMKLYSI